MGYNVTIKRSGEGLADVFARGTLVEMQSFPFRIGASADCDCPLQMDGAPQSLVFTENDDRSLSLTAVGGGQVAVNGTPMEDEAVLGSGARIEAGGWTLRVYRTHGRPGVSIWCNVLAASAIVAVTLVFLLELFMTAVMPVALKMSSSWDSYRDRQRILHEIEAMRKEFRAENAHTPLAQAFFACILEELNDETAYLRKNYNGLSRSQRKALSEHLEQLRTAGEALLENAAHEEAPRSDVDTAVRRILEL